ncbi:hypothetical protein Tco_0274978, partial [Tanacetum coccineum]
KKDELPPSSSSLSVSSVFSNQFLNLSSDTSLIGTLKDTTDVEINSLLDVQIQQVIPHIQSPSVLTVPVSVIPEPSILLAIPKIPSVVPATTFLPPLMSLPYHLSKIRSAVNAYLGTSLGDALQMALQKHTKELKQQYSQKVDYKEIIEES